VSLRLHLLLVSLSTLAIGLGAALVTANVLLAQRVHAETSTVLRAHADAQVAALSISGGAVKVRTTPNDATLDRRSWVLDGDRVLERPAGASVRLDQAAVALGRERRIAEVDGPGDTRLRAQPVFEPGSKTPVGGVVVALSLESIEQLQEGVLLGSLVIAALVLVAGGFAIRSALNGALRPVAQMTASAEDWGAHDLDRRFELGPPRDELTALAATLDLLLARIAASRRHEQHFASSVAHELRTPLAGLRARAELALSARGAGADAERGEALEAVIAQAARLDDAIGALLAVARQEIDPSQGTADLVALASELEGVRVDAPAGLPIAEGDPEIVRRALAPLVDNARRHARSAVRIELSAAGGRVRLAVRDDGPGLDPQLGERAFDPGVRGQDASADGGAGLGLALARRLARSCGGDIVAGPGPGGCFVLELPALGPQAGAAASAASPEGGRAPG
jgi:signal transduction histidine kinase